jgi:hypothetical protein
METKVVQIDLTKDDIERIRANQVVDCFVTLDNGQKVLVRMTKEDK